jgi:DNA-binding CsgD family transcriptional regulator
LTLVQKRAHLRSFDPDAEAVTLAVERHADRDVHCLAPDDLRLSDRDDHRVEVDDDVELLARARLPGPHVVRDRRGDLRDQPVGDVDAVQLAQVALDLPRRQPAGIQREDLIVEAIEAALVLGHDPRLETGVPIPGQLDLSQYVEQGYALELLQESAEGVGYLLKDRVYDLADFVAAVKRVAEGGSALDPSVVSQLVGRRRRNDPIDELSAREREVLELMAEGLSNSAIAARVFLSERGVEKHVTSIFQKLHLPVAANTHRRVLAVVAFLQS